MTPTEVFSHVYSQVGRVSRNLSSASMPVGEARVRILAVPFSPDFIEPSCSDEHNREGIGDLLTDLFHDNKVEPENFTLSHDEFYVDDMTVVVLFKDAVGKILLPETFKTRHHVGGCNEDHPGLCRLSCDPVRTTLRWKRVHTEERDGDVWAVFNGAMA